MIPSINYHLWEPCNFRCRFCFATFQDVKKSILPKGHLPESDALQLIKHIADNGIQKINFAGGEPTLCPWLDKLIGQSKNTYGLKTSVVTNGFELIKNDYALLKRLASNLDWIGLSIDSFSDPTNIKAGRAFRGRQTISDEQYINLAKKIKELGIRLKINSVVHRLNYTEDLTQGISAMLPERWKILQVLAVAGQNDNHIHEYAISNEQFQYFINQHSRLAKNGISIVPESNAQITGTYLMIDPAGRFYDDTKGTHTYSEPILKVGFKQAISAVKIDTQGFYNRGGYYDF